MPTQELLTDGPFRYCRNPMTLGAILAYLGMAVAVGTIAGTALVLCLAASLLVYLKRLEEGELAERFGEAYLAYRRQVPFIIPTASEAAVTAVSDAEAVVRASHHRHSRVPPCPWMSPRPPSLAGARAPIWCT